jgi:hypothetical protein
VFGPTCQGSRTGGDRQRREDQKKFYKSTAAVRINAQLQLNPISRQQCAQHADNKENRSRN